MSDAQTRGFWATGQDVGHCAFFSSPTLSVYMGGMGGSEAKDNPVLGLLAVLFRGCGPGWWGAVICTSRIQPEALLAWSPSG